MVFTGAKGGLSPRSCPSLSPTVSVPLLFSLALTLSALLLVLLLLVQLPLLRFLFLVPLRFAFPLFLASIGNRGRRCRRRGVRGGMFTPPSTASPSWGGRLPLPSLPLFSPSLSVHHISVLLSAPAALLWCSVWGRRGGVMPRSDALSLVFLLVLFLPTPWPPGHRLRRGRRGVVASAPLPSSLLPPFSLPLPLSTLGARGFLWLGLGRQG